MNSTKTIKELEEFLGDNAEFFWAYTAGMVKHLSEISPGFFFTKYVKECINSEIIGFTSKEFLAYLKDNQEMLKYYAYTFLLQYLKKDDGQRKHLLHQFMFGKDIRGNECKENEVSKDKLLSYR